VLTKQEAFTQLVTEDFISGDSGVSGSAQKQLMWNVFREKRYIHSSGQEMGRNGIGIGSVSNREMRLVGHIIGQLRCCGRVRRGYEPPQLYSKEVRHGRGHKAQEITKQC